MIYPWFDHTNEKIEDLNKELNILLDDQRQRADVFLTDEKFKSSALYSELTSRIKICNDFFLVIVKFFKPTVYNLNELISYIYLNLWGVPVHIDPDWMYKNFPWNAVLYKDEVIASGFKILDKDYVYSLFFAIPTYFDLGNPFMNYLSFNRIKARITGALYDAKIYGQCNSADDDGVQSPMCLLL